MIGKVNEGSVAACRLTFYDENGAVVNADSATYTLYCGATVVTAETPFTPPVLTLSATENLMQNEDADKEERLIIIDFVYSGGKHGVTPVPYTLYNMKGK